MDYYLVIPIHNEAAYLESNLSSIIKQTLLPKKVILVNDNSYDGSETIINKYCTENPIFQKLTIVSSTDHMPGRKVINAFNKGQALLDDNFDFIGKLDADIILPENYFEVIAMHFKNNTSIGICGGFIYEKNNSGDWVLNHPMDKDHVRGAIKTYSKSCFKAIGGLKNVMGWDTVDELLARFHGYIIQTDTSLKVKHLRPTGKAYNTKAKKLQGKAMYTMRYGFTITCIASLKMAWKNQSIKSFWNNMVGFLQASKNKTDYIVTEEEGIFIRRFRWRNISQKIKA
ncbi:glycosyltransferase family 2 protein [Maribacter hydrothermalis]|uniref:Glycosyl transferase family 2 n=1 Tax=Maribacter hydrothermalis TaxID=1836467 RepID=A0A1B7ZFP4_9FLAO|nr:glycosyltransferase family 2 protein [Maribacter hydrothermalis]APQ17896.1 glycosyl transferase family 2 [Maribacter hydrothermalis]OBR42368.1 glycosyl transferase family 2 [Maribacter hydrothermalis]